MIIVIIWSYSDDKEPDDERIFKRKNYLKQRNKELRRKNNQAAAIVLSTGIENCRVTDSMIRRVEKGREREKNCILKKEEEKKNKKI